MNSRKAAIASLVKSVRAAETAPCSLQFYEGNNHENFVDYFLKSLSSWAATYLQIFTSE